MSRMMNDSGVDWIGNIPDGWAVRPLKRLFTINSGATPKSDNPAFWDGNIRWITPADYTTKQKYISGGSRNITEAGYNSCSTTLVPVGSVIFSKRAPIGLVALSSEALCTNQGCLSCLPNKDCVSEFYYFAMSAVPEQFERVASGTTFKEISLTEFMNFKMPAPPVKVQHAVVSFLNRKCSAIDTAIAKTKESIEKLEEYRKAVITKAVTKGLDPDAKMKDSGVEWIGGVPENWNVKQLRMFYSRRINKNKNLQEKNLLSLSYGNIIRKNIDTNEGLLPDSFDGYNIVESGDIVIRGTDLQNDHRSLRTGLVTERGIITSAYMTLMPVNGDINSEYYHYLLHCYDIEKVFYAMGGGLRQSLDFWEFSRMMVPEPSKEEQDAIVEYINSKCSAIDSLITKKQMAIEKWEEYKKSLIYYAVTGKIDCREEAI